MSEGQDVSQRGRWELRRWWWGVIGFCWRTKSNYKGMEAVWLADKRKYENNFEKNKTLYSYTQYITYIIVWY